MGRDVGLTSLPIHADTSQGVGHLQIWTGAQKERETEVSHEGRGGWVPLPLAYTVMDSIDTYAYDGTKCKHRIIHLNCLLILDICPYKSMLKPS